GKEVIMMTGTGCWCVTLLLLLHRLVQSEWLILSPERFEVLGPTRAIFAVAGDDIILPCYIKPNITAEDMRVEWFNGTDKYHDQIRSYEGRTSLFKEELKKGNTSLKLTRVQGTDDGRYKCLVQSKTHYDDYMILFPISAVLNLQSTFVSVAIGSQPEVSIEGPKEGGMGLLCVSKGWFPEPELEKLKYFYVKLKPHWFCRSSYMPPP
uniref:Ig-like domain-containing protein n=1 Tax=Hucho hucho TaxID=62062 RepID=A0A4W5MRP7_9TELE